MTIRYERVPSFQAAVRQDYVVAVCETAGCKLQHVRLKVRLRTIECEVL